MATKRSKKNPGSVPGYSPSQINTLNGIIPGGTGVQGVPGVTNTPGGASNAQINQAIQAVQPLPQQPDPATQNAILAANNNITLAGADAAWQTGQLARSSGIDQNGNLITGGDAYDPYSQAMNLQNSWKQQKLGNTNSYAANGQLYSGALLNAQNAADTTYAGNFDQLKTGTLGSYHGINVGQLQTYANNTLGTGSQAFQSLYNRLYPSGS